jgi:CHAT domain-containing protein
MALDHYRRLLYSQLIRPIAPYFGHDEVIMAVDREFLQVPFSILISGDSTPLHDQFDLTLLVNPLDLKRRGTKWASGRACTIVGSDSESLPLVREECEAIHRIYADAKILTGESAGTDAVREALKESGGFVHIAAHAARASENPLFSRILLANGPLFPFEITGRVKAQLVTLSGCQTAAPGLYYGNSFSLAKAFYQAGGRSVLASQWSVADDITLEFMTEFYGYLSASGSVKRSYSKAVEKIRRLTDNPAHWGAFVLLGGMK